MSPRCVYQLLEGTGGSLFSCRSPAISVTDILYVFNTIELNAIKSERKSSLAFLKNNTQEVVRLL